MRSMGRGSRVGGIHLDSCKDNRVELYWDSNERCSFRGGEIVEGEGGGGEEGEGWGQGVERGREDGARDRHRRYWTRLCHWWRLGRCFRACLRGEIKMRRTGRGGASLVGFGGDWRE